MKRRTITMLTAFFLAAITLVPGTAQPAETNRVGVLLPLSGSTALYGNWGLNGIQIAADIINERGGLWGKKIELVKGDAVDPKAAVTEATRLINYEKIPLIIGTVSSPRAVPASEVANRNKVIYWETSSEAEKIMSRKLDYVFRPWCQSSDKARVPFDYVVNHVAPSLKKDLKSMRIGVAFEQGDYGTDTANLFMELARKQGLKIVAALSHDPATLDFSSDIMKLKAAKVDFLLFPSYLEPTAVFLRQSKELDFHVPGGICGGGGIDGIQKIIKTNDIDYLIDAVGPAALNPEFLKPGALKNLTELKKRYNAKFKEDPPIIALLTFSNSMVLFEDVLPRAGSLDPEAVRKAAIATDIPNGGTSLGYGVKFFPPGDPMQGQNMRSWAILTQYQNRKNVTVWPANVQLAKPWCPVPNWKERAKN